MAKNNFSKKNLLYILFIVSSMHSFQIACTPWHKKFFSLLKPTKPKPSSGSGMQVNNDSEKVNTNSNSSAPPPRIELNKNSNPPTPTPRNDLDANSNFEVSNESSIQAPQDPSLKDNSVFLKEIDEALGPLFNISKQMKPSSKNPPTPIPRKKFNTKEIPTPIPRKDLDANSNPSTLASQKDDDTEDRTTLLKEISDLFDTCCMDFDLNTEETPTSTPHKDLNANSNLEVSKESSTQALQDSSLKDSSKKVNQKAKAPAPPRPRNLDIDNTSGSSNNSSTSPSHNLPNKPPVPPRPKNLNRDNTSVISKK
ncbi:hypothetical protein NERG_01943 [Nematocida ausubeli]|uniref:Uncharacterized protein n=1 Tax=Nematocida ausubeli (strain ATCC PRA-371 / ERTm2) TaxID=1913371 RepID=H8ZEC2_NEMA1|nr:hypothetical protein NERG_01943 [Nematocida ausubeli]